VEAGNAGIGELDAVLAVAAEQVLWIGERNDAAVVLDLQLRTVGLTTSA
jgi:hypothetical protein